MQDIVFLSDDNIDASFIFKIYTFTLGFHMDEIPYITEM